MKRIGVFEAKTHLSELIDAGIAVTITKHGKPVALLTPLREAPQDVIARIRTMRAGPKRLSMKTILEFTRAGRR